MPLFNDTRAKNLVLGAVVADAAAMGTHWIYDQAHIATIAPDTPEFMTPDAANYEDVPGYFAHANRASGQTSQYGEQAIVMLKALAAQGGTYNARTYATAFRAHFGYGGAWVGYIDHATRDTLNNFLRAEDRALDAARAIPFDGAKEITIAMVTKAMALASQFSGPALRQKFEEAVRITHSDEAVLAHGFKVLDAVLAIPPSFGAVDQQLPAIAKLPALVASVAGQNIDDAAFFKMVDSAVRTTSDHERSIAFGRVCARMMQAALTTDDMAEIVSAGRAVATPETDALLQDALNRLGEDTNTVTRHFGMACDLNYGVPNVVHNMMTAPTYTDAIRRNIHAGGDTCGRAILLGSILGAIHGVGGTNGIPAEWIDRLRVDSTTLGMIT